MIKHSRKLTLLLALCLGAGAMAQQIYRITDDKGDVVFTDKPSSAETNRQVEEVELPPINRSSAVEVPKASRRTEQQQAAPTPEPTVSITAPENETTIAMGPGNFTVSAAVEPPLANGETLQLLMDGQAQGESQRSGSWAIEGAMRGPHDLLVERRGRGGEVLARSDSVRIYVLRPSIRR
jgi:hypothetical protein